MAAAAGKPDLKKQLLEQLDKVKPDDRLNFLVNRLVNLESDGQRLVECLEAHRKETERANQLDKKLKQTEKSLSKAELTKSKLEELCRELNRSKKEDADRSTKRLREIEKAHQETVESLKSSLGDIQKSMEDRRDQAKRMQDVEDISKSLTSLSEEYERRLGELKHLYEDREEKVKDMMQTKDQELDYLRKQIEDMRSKVEDVFKENVDLKQELILKEKKYMEVTAAQLGTREIVSTYEQKYNELAKTLSSSDSALERARKEMAKMNGQLIKLQGDAFRYKKQFEETNKLVVRMKSENEDLQKAQKTKDRQLEQLQGLCRRLQKAPAEEEAPPN